MIITQWLMILPLALLYLRKHKLRFSEFARMAPLKRRYIPVIVVLAFSSWIIGTSLGAAVAELLTSQGLHIPREIIPYPETVGQLAFYFLGMVVSASICEEIFFRGTVMPTFEQQGTLQGVPQRPAFCLGTSIYLKRCQHIHAGAAHRGGGH